MVCGAGTNWNCHGEKPTLADWVILLNNYTPGVLLINCLATDYCAWASKLLLSSPLRYGYYTSNLWYWQTTSAVTKPSHSFIKKTTKLNQKLNSDFYIKLSTFSMGLIRCFYAQKRLLQQTYDRADYDTIHNTTSCFYALISYLNTYPL